MSLIAITAAIFLFSQNSTPAPRYEEADVAALESCAFGRGDLAECGDFSADVDALQACAAGADLQNGVEQFSEQWVECNFVLPCSWEKPGPGQTALVLRNCAARSVAAKRILARRWLAELEPRLSQEDRALLTQVEKQMTGELPLPADSEDPLGASGRWSGSWASYLQFLRFVQLTGKLAR